MTYKRTNQHKEDAEARTAARNGDRKFERDVKMTGIRPKQNYRPGELAEAAGVSVRTVCRWLRRGLVNHVHFMGVIRIPREEYERVLRDGIPRGGPVVPGSL